MVVCCRKAPFARFDRSAYTSESGGGRRISETVNPAGFPWITTRELSVCATNCAASSATGPVGGVRSAGSNDLPSTSTIRMGAIPRSRSYSFAPSPTTTIVSAPRRYRRAAAARSEEHTSELQSRLHLVCRLLLEKKKRPTITAAPIIHYARQE